MKARGLFWALVPKVGIDELAYGNNNL